MLDTNVALNYLLKPQEIKPHVQDILDNCYNIIFVSSVAVVEMMHLFNNGKIRTRKWQCAQDILSAMDEMEWTLMPVKREHIAAFGRLSIAARHNDPNDHLIISQAIAERITLISADRQFEPYTLQGLRFIFNER